MNQSRAKPDLDKIREDCVVNFCTPAYGGSITVNCFRSYLQTISALEQNGIRNSLSTLSNESLITRARNSLVANFLQRRDNTHLFFIDSDIGFEARAVVSMLWSTLISDAEIVVGAYRTKMIDWSVVVKQVRNGLVDPKKLEISSGKYAIRLSQSPRVNPAGLVEVMEAGSGFMLIKRSALERMAKTYNELSYVPDSLSANRDGDTHFAFFDTGITGRPPLDKIDEPDGRYLSEDYYFCHLWRQLGGAIWLDTSAALSHTGRFTYHGDIGPLIPRPGGHADGRNADQQGE